MSATGTSRLPARARAVIAGVAIAGVAASVGVWRIAAHQGFGSISIGLFLSGLVLLTRVFPLRLLHRNEVTSVHFDEASFVVLAMLLPPLGVLACFACVLVVMQVLQRRSVAKCVFNWGITASAVATGLLAMRAIAGSASPRTLLGFAAMTAAAFVLLGVNLVWLVLLHAALSRRSILAVVRDMTDIIVLVTMASVIIALVTGLAAISNPWLVPGAFVPFLVLRQILAGHFRARHDRARLKGLFDATLQMHGHMGEDAVEGAIRAAAAELLRGECATITHVEPQPGELAVHLDDRTGGRWLRVERRKRLEPTELADQAMLETLAAVGAGALANAAMFEEITEQRQRLAAITASLGEGVCALDSEGRVTFLNPAGRAMLALSAEDEVGGIRPPKSMMAAAMRCMRNRSTVRNDDAVFERTDGSALAVGFTCSPVITNDEVTGTVIAFSDITERKAFEERLAHHAFHDMLTGLANRRLFLDHLDHAMLRSQRQGEVHAVLFFDVDRFKLVNDNLGHQDGDELLKVVASRLGRVTRAGDTLARFGGDEFILLVENVSGIDEAVNVAERVQSQFTEPVVLAGHKEIFVTASIGVALATGQRSRDDVLHDADVAMYRAKGRGPGEIEVFDQGAMAARSAERLDMEAALRHGIERGEIEVHYQPIYDASTTRITGAEALVRWNHPTRGFLSPVSFVPIAEDSGLILPLGRLVLETACRQARIWHDQFDSTLDITVNLSARQFQHAGLTADIARVLEETCMVPEHLCLEITETLAMADTGRTISILDTLKRLGLRLAIDDFGTGYSSLSYLKEFPVDVVKIDRSFVAGIGESDVDEAIVAAVVALSRAVRMSTVAEGVETADQLAHLVGLGCDRVQGFYLAKPMPAASFTSLLGRQFALQDA